MSLITSVFICNEIHAQSNLEMNLGSSFSYLMRSESNDGNGSIKWKEGKYGSILIKHRIENGFFVKAGFEFLNKGYERRNKASSNTIYEIHSNGYVHIPIVLTKEIMKINAAHLEVNMGGYSAFWWKKKIEGTIPNAFDSFLDRDVDNELILKFRLSKYSSDKEFLSNIDRRIEFGMVIGGTMRYQIFREYYLQIGSSCYFSFLNKKKAYMVNVVSEKNLSIVFFLGVGIPI